MDLKSFETTEAPVQDLPPVTSPAPAGPAAQLPKRPPSLRFSVPTRSKPPKPINCLNCGTALTGQYCSHCGQEAEDHRTAIWPLISDALGEFFKWDSKLLRTAVPLLIRPGFLTNEYNSGKRATYLSPFKMYLTVSVVFFLLLFSRSSINFVNFDMDDTPKSSAKAPVVIKMGDQRAKELDEARAQLAAQAAANSDNLSGPILRGVAASLPKQPLVGSKPALKPNQARNDAYAKVPKLFPKSDGKISVAGETLVFNQLPATYAQYQALQKDPSYPYKNGPVMQRMIGHFYRFFGNRDLRNKTVEDLVPKIMFFVMPFFALTLYMMYWRAGRYYVEHLVFALHNHTFAFLALTAMLYSPDAVKNWLSLAVAAYLYVSMLVVYKQNWFLTLLKFGWAGFNYMILVTVAALITFVAAFFLT